MFKYAIISIVVLMLFVSVSYADDFDWIKTKCKIQWNDDIERVGFCIDQQFDAYHDLEKMNLTDDEIKACIGFMPGGIRNDYVFFKSCIERNR